MKSYSLSHLADSTLVCGLAAVTARENADVAEMLAYLAEVDARKLYLPAAYSSMYHYCIGELHMSEDSAAKRIRAARAARQYPAIFAAVEAGQLHLSAVVLLAPHLTRENADELLVAATHKTKSEIELLLAQRFPKLDVPNEVRPEGTPIVFELSDSRPAAGPHAAPAPGRVELHAAPPVSAHVERPASRGKVTPLSPQRFALQFTIEQDAHDKLRYAQALLGHAVPAGELAELFVRALDALILTLEKQKFAKCSRSRQGSRCHSTDPRCVPAEVRRGVWLRDEGRCTFTSRNGRRCEARTRLEFDHVEPVARGGQASITNIRLRCRAHNQFEAERTFGTEFMSARRYAAVEARARARTHPTASPQLDDSDVIPWLRRLGFRADEARHAAGRCESIPGAPLEERVRVALSFLSASTIHRCRAVEDRVTMPSSA